MLRARKYPTQDINYCVDAASDARITVNAFFVAPFRVVLELFTVVDIRSVSNLQ